MNNNLEQQQKYQNERKRIQDPEVDFQFTKKFYSETKRDDTENRVKEEIFNLSRPHSTFMEPQNEDSAMLKNHDSVKAEGNHSEIVTFSEPLKNDHLISNEEIRNIVKSRKSVDDESIFNKIIALSDTSKAKLCASQNIGVLNMVLETPPSEPLPPDEAAAIADALEESVDSLKILEYTIPAEIDKLSDESYKTIDEKYSDQDEAENMVGEHTGHLPLIPTVAEKLQRDRTYVYNILEKTLQDIKTKRIFDPLKVEVENIAKTVEDERDLQIEHEIWSDLVKQLQDLVVSQKAKYEEELKESTELAENGDIEADNSIFLNSSKLNYVKRWEDDRLNQQNLKMEMEEQKIVDELNKTGKEERAERIVSEDVQAYLQDHTAYLKNEITEWSNNNNEEIFRKQREIYSLREAIDERKENLEELYNLYYSRQAFIDECYEEKARVKREMEYWKTVNHAATIIQSIWRGYMVRNQLGEYQGLRAKLRKRKKLAAIARKKQEAWQKKKAKKWGDTKLKTMKNIVDPNA